MDRKILEELKKWKSESNGRTAILIDGARRVGKSYIAEKFARENYKSYILIDFYEAEETIKELFTSDMRDLDSFFSYLSAIFNTPLYPRESLIIFDEVQMVPKARGRLKYLVADGRYDYLETGSLMSIRKNVKDIIIPSEEQHINMYPMDFEEFLWAMGNKTLMPLIRSNFEEKKPMGQSLHRMAMNYFRQYVIVGGMPQAVKEYSDTQNFAAVDRIKRNILTLYRADIRKHADGCELEVEAIFDDIPGQLSRHEKKYKLSDLAVGASTRRYSKPFFWLNDSMIINSCYNATEPNLGLKLTSGRRTMKCYFIDTGLLVSHAFDENGLVSQEIYKKILLDKLNINEGMLMENVVAQMLVASGHKLYFFSRSSRSNAMDRMEIDFLIAKQRITSKHNIAPIEVKSGDRYALSSIRKYREKYAEYMDVPYVLHTKDLKIEDGITYLPLYMTMLL